MVWCAKESADFEPGNSNAMQLFGPYGWIHWDAISNSWHTVTGYYLGPADGPAKQIDVPVSAAFVQERRGVDRSLADFLGQELAADGAQQAPVAPDAVVAERRAASAAADSGTPDLTTQPRPEAGSPPNAADPTTWDADHKRDEDRADTRLALTNSRWDAQHALDNSRWDTRHTLDNSRWDTQHTLDNARWDTRRTTENARWDASLALKRAREDAALAADMALLSSVHGAYITVAQGSLDRAVQRATYVTTAAGAIGTLYTAILAARYTTNHQAPARSLLPALFIGAAVAFSTWYMAFLRGQTRHQQLLVSGTGGNIAETRLLDFMEWTFGGVLARAWSLRVSVISLALGLALLPVGMVQLSSRATWQVGIAAAFVIVLWLAGEAYVGLGGPGVDKYRERLQRRPPRLALPPPTLPPPPRGGFKSTRAPSYGMAHAPPTPPARAGAPEPPPPPDVAIGPPPAAPLRADDLDPPAAPEDAVGPPPAGPAKLAPEQRPLAPQQTPSPTELKVDVRLTDDRANH